MYWNYISLQYDSFYNDAKTIGILLNATEIHSVQIIVWQQIKKKYTASFIKLVVTMLGKFSNWASEDFSSSM